MIKTSAEKYKVHLERSECAVSVFASYNSVKTVNR